MSAAAGPFGSQLTSSSTFDVLRCREVSSSVFGVGDLPEYLVFARVGEADAEDANEHARFGAKLNCCSTGRPITFWGVQCGESEACDLFVSIPDDVRDICDRCFKDCEELRRVTFGASSSLVRIGVRSFAGIDIVEISIPDSVRELCDKCFSWCEQLTRVTFGASSSLERIGVGCFERSGITEISIPDSVRELCDRWNY